MKLKDNSMMKSGSRGGFTLLEVTIALGLGAFLMLAVFQTFLIAARYRNLADGLLPFGVGLANAIRDLRSDLNGIALDCRQFANIDAKASESNKLDSILRTNLQDNFIAASTEWVSFASNGDYLAMTTKSWNPRFGQLPTNMMSSGNCLVIWWQYTDRSPSIDAWRSKSLPVSKPLVVPQDAAGLIRTQVWLDAQGKEHQRSEVIHPGVRDLKFLLHQG